jgi:hypothetical protein
MNDQPSDQPQDGVHEGGSWPPAPESSSTTEDATPRVGFCQDCGKPLTAQTVRMVGTGLFCEPCLAARVAASSAAGAASGAAGYANIPPADATPIPPPVPLPGTGHPGLAAALGLIPGVGAMYNGQFAKGVAHLVIFVLLKLLEDISGVFGIFVVAWVCYQVIDAYQTAKARQYGLPLPNPFGLNEIGERMGFGKGWPNGAGTWGSATPPPPPASWQATPPPPSTTAADSIPVNPTPVNTAPNWVGYIPPTHFAGNQPPYQQPYTAPYTAPGSNVPYTPVPPPAAAPGWTGATSPATSNRLPMAALWLIALGALILIVNMVPHWGVDDRWFPPLLLAGLAVWIFLRRLRRGASVISVVRGPLILMLMAIYFGLKALFFTINFGMFVAIILIAFGVLLLLERVIGSGPGAAPAYPPTYGPPVTPPRASFVPVAEQPATPPADTPEGDPR